MQNTKNATKQLKTLAWHRRRADHQKSAAVAPMISSAAQRGRRRALTHSHALTHIYTSHACIYTTYIHSHTYTLHRHTYTHTHTRTNTHTLSVTLSSSLVFCTFVYHSALVIIGLCST